MMTTTQSRSDALQDTEPERKAFLRMFSDRFSEALRTVEGQELQRDKRVLLREIRITFESDKYVSDKKWEMNKRFLSVLYSGMNTGGISFRDEGDMEAFSFMMDMHFELVPDIIEHYIATEEIIELTCLLRGEIRNLSPVMGTGYGIQAKLQRLYDFDMSSADHRELPLDIRIAFSGFLDNDVTLTEVKNLPIWGNR